MVLYNNHNDSAIDIRLLSQNKAYLNGLVKKGILSESELRSFNPKKFLLFIKEHDVRSYYKNDIRNIVNFFKTLGFTLQNIAPGYDKINGVLKYASEPISGGLVSELEDAYDNCKLIATGRSYYTDEGAGSAQEFYYNGKLYTRCVKSNKWPLWYEVTPIDFIVDYEANQVFSTKPVIPENVELDSPVFNNAIKQQVKPSGLFDGDSSKFNMSSSLFKIECGKLKLEDSSLEYIPYGVSSVEFQNTDDRELLIFPRTVRNIDFAYSINAGNFMEVSRIDLCDNVLLGDYVKFDVSDKIILHYHDFETLTLFLDQLSGHLTDKYRSSDFGNRAQKIISKASSKRFKLVLELRGPRLDLSKADKIKLKSYGFDHHFVEEDDYRSASIPDIFKKDSSKGEKSENVFQKRLDELRKELEKYIGYYSDGDKRLSDFDSEFNTVSEVIRGFKPDDNGKITEEVLRNARDAFEQFIRNWEGELIKYKNKENYYEIIDYIDKCIEFLDGTEIEYDGEFLRRFVSCKRKSGLIDSKTANYFRLIASRYLSSEKKLVQNFIGMTDTDASGVEKENTPCASIPELELSLEKEFSDLFALIDLAAEANGIKDVMISDLWMALAQPFDDANKQYISYFKKNANGIVNHIRQLATSAPELMNYLDKCRDIIQFFMDSSVIDDSEEFKTNLTKKFPDLFPDDDRATAFERAFAFCKPVVSLGNQELVKLVNKYTYMTAALMELETVLDEQVSRRKEFDELLGVTLPPSPKAR